MNQPSSTFKLPPQKHAPRTFLAVLFGTIATLLLVTSILVVWANRTIINNDTYVATVTPLASNTEVRSYLANQFSDQLLSKAQVPQLAQALLPASTVDSQNLAQLTSDLKTVVDGTLNQVFGSAAFRQLWISTNRSIHSQLINQLNSDNSSLVLNLKPTLNSMIGLLSNTNLAAYQSQISFPASAGQVKIDGTPLVYLDKAYKLFNELTWLIVITTVVFIGLAFWISVHHLKTLRHIMVISGVFCLVITLALYVPYILQVTQTLHGSSTVVGLNVVNILINRLRLSFLIIGLVLILLAIASKLYSRYQTPKVQTSPKLKT